MNKNKITRLLLNNEKILHTVRGYANGVFSHTHLIFYITSLCLENEKILNETEEEEK